MEWKKKHMKKEQKNRNIKNGEGKVAKKIKDVCSYISRALSFPHMRLALILLVGAIITLVLSVVIEKAASYWSSVLSNVFAGLITGLVLCLVSGSRQRNIAGMNTKLEWLKNLDKVIQRYSAEYSKLRQMKNFTKYEEQDDTLFEFIYDVAVCAEDINTVIIQSTFNKNLPFNSLNFCKETFGYDADKMSEQCDDLLLQINAIDIKCPGKKEIVGYFDSVQKEIKNLKYNIYSEIKSTNDYLEEINKTII